jgi:sulfur carrier protein ThiS
MNVSHRTQTLLDRLPTGHPLAPAMRDAMIAALAAAEGFSGHKIALASDRRMTPLGRRQALQEALTANHGKAWARAAAAVQKQRKEITARRDALVIKEVGQSYAAVHGRWEIRQWLLSLDESARQAVAQATNDVRLLEAMLTAPPQLSGVNLPALAGKIEQRYREVTYPAELAAIALDDSVVSEAETACTIARNELRSVLDAVEVVESVDGVTRHELLSVADNPHAFDALMKPVETVRPWLMDDGKQVCEIGADGKPSYRLATAADREIGFKGSYDEYKALAGLANAA